MKRFTLTASQQAKLVRIALNVFRGIMFMKELRPSVVEVGNEDIIEKMRGVQEEFVANQRLMEEAKAIRLSELLEERRKLEDLEAELTGENTLLDEKIAHSKRVAKRYAELHA